MEELLYPMIFKRKAFHRFSEILEISEDELKDVTAKFKQFTPLVEDIRVEMKIVSASEIKCKIGAEYCILLYSEKKNNYLQNIGYIGEQLDLYLSYLNIGALWFGMGKTKEEKMDDLDFVIMIAIAKLPEDKFRKDMNKIKRKRLNEIYTGTEHKNIFDVARFAPSALNGQPWIVEEKGNELSIFRYKKQGIIKLVPTKKLAFYNRIDIGIFLLFVDLCLKHNNINLSRQIYAETNVDTIEKTLVARYLASSGT